MPFRTAVTTAGESGLAAAAGTRTLKARVPALLKRETRELWIAASLAASDT